MGFITENVTLYATCNKLLPPKGGRVVVVTLGCYACYVTIVTG